MLIGSFFLPYAWKYYVYSYIEFLWAWILPVDVGLVGLMEVVCTLIGALLDNSSRRFFKISFTLTLLISASNWLGNFFPDFSEDWEGVCCFSVGWFFCNRSDAGSSSDSRTFLYCLIQINSSTLDWRISDIKSRLSFGRCTGVGIEATSSVSWTFLYKSMYSFSSTLDCWISLCKSKLNLGLFVTGTMDEGGGGGTLEPIWFLSSIPTF
jgi:hypothetical protein